MKKIKNCRIVLLSLITLSCSSNAMKKRISNAMNSTSGESLKTFFSEAGQNVINEVQEDRLKKLEEREENNEQDQTLENLQESENGGDDVMRMFELLKVGIIASQQKEEKQNCEKKDNQIPQKSKHGRVDTRMIFDNLKKEKNYKEI